MFAIRLARPGDLPEILRVYSAARDFMIRSGNPGQWGKTHPAEALIREDIAAGRCRVVEAEGVIRGVFALMEGEEPTYRVIGQGAWLNAEPYLTLHRVASDGETHGLFSTVASWAKERTDNVRVDTHRNNLPMQRQIEKNGFIRCGIIHVDDGSERIAYQWTRG